MTAERKQEDLKDPIEKVRKYNIGLRKDLVRLYRFIDKFKDTDTHGGFIKFTEKGAWQAARFTQLFKAELGSKYYKKFIANLDNIKILSDEEPTAKVKFKCKLEEDIPVFYSPNRTDEESKKLLECSKKGYEWEQVVEYKAYEDGDFDEFIKKNSKRRHYYSHEIIEKCNF